MTRLLLLALLIGGPLPIAAQGPAQLAVDFTTEPESLVPTTSSPPETSLLGVTNLLDGCS